VSETVNNQRCDDDAPHIGHHWTDGENNWWCSGRRAHANVMIGRNG